MEMTTYENYIHPDRLPPVEPLEKTKEDPDESFFIRTHQVFEIWFAQILAELEFARSKLSAYVEENDVPPITHHVRRATAIFDVVRAHLPLLESLQTTSFYDFRRQLFGGSGLQSYRFREIEWLMGFRDQDLLDYTEEKLGIEKELKLRSLTEAEHRTLRGYQRQTKRLTSNIPPQLTATRDALTNREEDLRTNGTLRKHALEWLERTPYPSAEGNKRPDPEYGGLFAEKFRTRFQRMYEEDLGILVNRKLMPPNPDTRERSLASALKRTDWFLQTPGRRAILFILQFADQPLLAWPAELLEALLALDQAFSVWRDRHIAMVSRVLGGGRISTTGAPSSGLPYLQGTLGKRFLPEIWDARTFLLGTKEAEGIYAGEPGNWKEWAQHRMAFELSRPTPESSTGGETE